jgi:predicted dehydrogenase
VSAVPACQNLEDAARLSALKRKTGLRYMMAESTYYRDGCRYARDLFRQGGFGELFYTEAEYYHDSNVEQALANRKSLLYNPDGSVSWRQNNPPFHYPTHSVSFLVGVTGERITEVACLGWGDRKLLGKMKRDLEKNPFADETALMRTSGGHALRCNEFRQVASPETERAQWFGEKGSFYMAKPGYHGDLWHARYGQAPQPVELPKYWAGNRFPEKMRHTSHHGNSATWITAEFIDALLQNREPEIDLYFALAVTVPGIVAHQSALRNGEKLKVPSFDARRS